MNVCKIVEYHPFTLVSSEKVYSHTTYSRRNLEMRRLEAEWMTTHSEEPANKLGYFQDSIPGYPHLYHPLCLNLGNVYIIKLAPWYTREEYRTKHLSHQRKGRKALFCLYIYINTTFILVLKACICNRISDVFTNSLVLAIEPWHWILTIFSDSTALHIYILCSTRFQPQQLYTK